MERFNNNEQYSGSNRMQNDRSCCRPCDRPRNGENGRQQGSNTNYRQAGNNAPSTSRFPRDIMCTCDDICTPAADFNSGRSSLVRSNFLPDTTQNLMNSELNNTLFHSQRDERGNGAQQNATMDKENLLIEDTYDPGLIEDSVECRKDFNAVSFGLFFESIQHIPKKLPPRTPMSLLEAFRKRIDYERNHLLDATSFQNNDRKLTVQSVETFFSNKPKTNLNTALLNLYKAEALFKAQNTTGGVQAEGEEAYDLEIRKTTQPLVGGAPITVESFVGTTTPRKKNPTANTKNEKDSKK